MISVVIPVRDGGEELRRCLDAVVTQRVAGEVELVVIDSGSRDGSVELARERGAHVHQIDPREFDHGATRNLGVSLAQGETVVFTSQDAYAEHDDWLAELTAPLAADPKLAGVYGRQIAHHGAAPPERYFLDFLYGPSSRRQRVGSASELSMRTTLFSNANAAVPRRLLLEHPFVEDIVMTEDGEWATRMLLGGREIAYVAEAAVRHSHSYSLTRAFRRFFDSGASSERAYMAGARPSREVLRAEARRYAAGELRWLWGEGHRRWLPYAVLYEGVKFLGLALGTRHAHLPLWLKLRASALPAYWRRHAVGAQRR